MSNEYVHSFISSLVLGNFYVEEFDDFQATGISTPIEIFKNTYKLFFYINDDNKLAWKATEHGGFVFDGTVQVVIKYTPAEYGVFALYDKHANYFIESLFPHRTYVEQEYQDDNIFIIDGYKYDFDLMTAKDGFINFEFKQ